MYIISYGMFYIKTVSLKKHKCVHSMITILHCLGDLHYIHLYHSNKAQPQHHRITYPQLLWQLKKKKNYFKMTFVGKITSKFLKLIIISILDSAILTLQFLCTLIIMYIKGVGTATEPMFWIIKLFTCLICIGFSFTLMLF